MKASPGEQRPVGVDDELLGPLGEPAHPAAIELDLGGPQSGQVQHDRRRRVLGDGVQDGVPGEAVAADPVVQIEFVPRHPVGVGPVARHIRIRGAGDEARRPLGGFSPLMLPRRPLLLGALVLNGPTFGCGAGGRARAGLPGPAGRCRPVPRADRVAHPVRAGRDGFAPHDERRRPHRAAVADPRLRQDDAVRSHGGPVIERNSVDAHDTVME